ncbi:MAG: hypothetical protein ACTSRP_15945 [Candidatus Helarchaeota archaeon]
MILQKIRKYIESNFKFFFKLLIYGYLAFILIGYHSFYNFMVYWPWYDWSKYTTIEGDIIYYSMMAEGKYEDVIAPYKYRVLVPFLWSIFLPLMPLRHSVLIWNFIFLFSNSFLIDRYLRHFEFEEKYIMFGVILTNISFTIIQVAYTPNLDIALLFFAFLFMIGIVEDNPWIIGISSILGVITKESFLFLLVIYFIYNFSKLKEALKDLFKRRKIPEKTIILSITFILISFIIFLLIRGFTFNVNYDYDLMKGEWPDYYKRYLSLKGIINVLKWSFYSITIIWIGPLGYIIHRWRLDPWFTLSLYGIFIIFIASLLSSRITRVVFFIIVIYLPIFLRFIKDFENNEKYSQPQ